MPRKLRFGILGTGNIANQFAAGVLKSARCEVAAVGSRSAESAAAFARQFEVAAAHGSYDALIADPNVDAIYVSTPNSGHREWTIRSLRAGKHVLCEKPFAMDAAEAEEMFDESARAGRVLVEAFMYLSHPQTLAYVDAIRRGAIGELNLIRSAFCYATKKIDGNVRFVRNLGGGALMDVGCYCVSLARLLFAAEPTGISATANFHEPSSVDDLTSAVLTFPGGRQSTFTCAMRTHGDNSAFLCGTEGWIEVAWPWKPTPGVSGFTIARNITPRQDAHSGSTSPQHAKPSTPPTQPREYIKVPVDGDVFKIEADDFAATVLDSAPPRLSRSFTVGNMDVLDEIRRQIGLRWN
jgi:predicted dehydrogenase